MQQLSFQGFYHGAWGKTRGKTVFSRGLPFKWPGDVADTGVMQALHKNEILLFNSNEKFPTLWDLRVCYKYSEEISGQSGR